MRSPHEQRAAGRPAARPLSLSLSLFVSLSLCLSPTPFVGIVVVLDVTMMRTKMGRGGVSSRCRTVGGERGTTVGRSSVEIQTTHVC